MRQELAAELRDLREECCQWDQAAPVAPTTAVASGDRRVLSEFQSSAWLAPPRQLPPEPDLRIARCINHQCASFESKSHQVSNCQQINAAPTTPKSMRPTKFIQKIMGCALRTISRLPRARNEPSRNIRNISRELTKRTASPLSRSKTLTIVHRSRAMAS